jgi:Cof subfamily protein (haloacid dehalogenase superfamily)
VSENKIELVVVDLDGTLMSSDHKLSERNEAALKAAIEQGVRIVLATGKTRQSARDIIERLGLDTPGIYLQGLAVYDGEGNITSEKLLDPAVARQVITFAEDRGFDVVLYSGYKILVRQLSQGARELTEQYGEPTPEAIGPLQNVLDEIPVHKLIITRKGEVRKVKALRWQLSKQLDGKGRLVQAMIPDMLEVLPSQASKGAALKTLLKQLGVAPENVLAMGDGENDIEMLELAGVGVAVGNADQRLKDVADHVVATNDEDAVANVLEKFVLKQTLAQVEAKTTNASAEEQAEQN